MTMCNVPQLRYNRAICFAAISNFQNSVSDISKSINLLEPIVGEMNGSKFAPPDNKHGLVDSTRKAAYRVASRILASAPVPEFLKLVKMTVENESRHFCSECESR